MNQYDVLPRFSCVDCWRRIEDHASYSHDTTKPPNFVEVITNEFTDETIKASNDSDDDHNQEEVKLQDVDDLFDDIPSAREDDQDVYGGDGVDVDYCKEENDVRESGTFCV